MSTTGIPELTPEEIAEIEERKDRAMAKIRFKRDALMNSTDKYAMLDYPINDKLRDKLKWYRQHLRDLPGMSSPDLDEDGNLTGVEWPTFEGIEVKVTPPSAHEKDLETTRINLATLQATLEATKTDLKADLSETKADLQTTATNLQTTQTELTEERTLHETTRTQLRNTQTELDVAKIKLLNIEARMQIIESNISKVSV